MCVCVHVCVFDCVCGHKYSSSKTVFFFFFSVKLQSTPWAVFGTRSECVSSNIHIHIFWEFFDLVFFYLHFTVCHSVPLFFCTLPRFFSIASHIFPHLGNAWTSTLSPYKIRTVKIKPLSQSLQFCCEIDAWGNMPKYKVYHPGSIAELNLPVRLGDALLMT